MGNQNKYYKHFLACGICYANCFFDDKLKCSPCDKYCHRSCLEMPKSKFNYMSRLGLDEAICSNKCCAKILPFYTITDKIFLDTNVGKRKIPCKRCYRECYKVRNSVKCSNCSKWHHYECIDSRMPTSSTLSNSFVCSK